MKIFKSRLTITALLISAFFVALATSRSAQGQTTNFVYHPELGGYLDSNTGLVWGNSCLRTFGTLTSWDYAQGTFLTRYRALTGVAAWRQPTVSELQIAGARGISTAVNLPASGNYLYWTSEKRGKGHYAVEPSESYVELLGNGSAIDAIAVYQAFTP